jgi:hypothetical protein
MLLKSNGHALDSGEKARYRYFTPEGLPNANAEFLPHFYVEARIDFNDVRTGFRETVSLSKALEICSDNADLLWESGMIREVDPRKVKSVMPDFARLRRLPGFVDANFISRMETQFIQYLLRSYKARVCRNSTLLAYSGSGESREDFVRRCRELLDGPMRQELDGLREVFNRRLGQITQKYLRAGDSGRLEEDKAASQDKDVFSRYSERIAGLFLRAGPKQRSVAGPPPRRQERQELEEQLSSLELEVQGAITMLVDSYEDKAQSIDEYILHPNLKDIHFVRTCILWMPAQAA